MNAEPYVTFVSYFRNDNYTSDFVLRVRRATPPPVESWLQYARGVARPGETTGKVMALTRDEE